jgi:hypothetical protein
MKCSETLLECDHAGRVPLHSDRVARWQTTKWHLFSALAHDGASVVLKSVEREDGSGRKFNVVLHHNGVDYKCFATTEG